MYRDSFDISFFFFTLDTLSGLLRMISRDYNVIHLRLMGPGVTVISLWDFSTIILGFLVFLDENQKKKKKEKKRKKKELPMCWNSCDRFNTLPGSSICFVKRRNSMFANDNHEASAPAELTYFVCLQ